MLAGCTHYRLQLVLENYINFHVEIMDKQVQLLILCMRNFPKYVIGVNKSLITTVIYTTRRICGKKMPPLYIKNHLKVVDPRFHKIKMGEGLFERLGHMNFHNAIRK